MDPEALLEEITDLAGRLSYLKGKQRDDEAQQTAENLARAADDLALWIKDGGFF